MAAGWSTTLLCILSGAAGWIACDWQSSRQKLQSAEAVIERLSDSAEKVVSAERRITSAVSRSETSKKSVEKAVAESSLADCPVPSHIGKLLYHQAEATRTNAGASEASVRMRGHSSQTVSGSGSN